MLKVISEFYFDIYKLKKIYQTLEIDPITKEFMLNRINTLLKHYEENKWTKLQVYYNEFCSLYGYDNNFIDCKLVYLIILDILEDNIVNFDAIYLDAVIQAFIYKEVNPINYKRYLNIFLDNEIKDSIYALDDVATPMTFVMISIIEYSDLDTLEKDNYAQVIYLLNRLKGIYPSPIFNDNYNLFNIYSSLKKNMDNLNTHNNYFTLNDYQIIKYLTEIEQFLTAEEKNKLKTLISDIEKNYEFDKRYLIKQIIKKIDKFYHSLNNSIRIKVKK